HGVDAATVVCPGGCYGGGRIRNYCHGVYSGAGYYGFFRRYYGYPFYGPSYPVASQRFDFGGCPLSGIVYSSGYGFHGGLCAHGPVLPLYDGPEAAASRGGINSSGVPANAPAAPPAKEPPPPDNTAHLQLLVPEKAEVLIDDGKTTRTGTVREFVSPPLTPGKSFVYKVIVRYTDVNGTTTNDEHSIRVHANDRLRMDFTSPRPQQEVASGR
ncbi:MAG TPA: TIGR03000 domain-containing protein, partial [Gemmataceae bacterium]